MHPLKYLIITDSAKEPISNSDAFFVVTARDYIANNLPAECAVQGNLRVINLCSDYRYLRAGYYCSLLAEARGHRCIPGASDVVHTNWKRLHKRSIPELEALANQTPFDEAMLEDQQALFFFGRTAVEPLQRFGRQLFDIFRLPIIRVQFARRKDSWIIKDIEPVKLSELDKKLSNFHEALEKYTGSFWSKKKKDTDKYWMAILHNPEEEFPPSNAKALKNFIRVGKRRRFYVELITKNNLDTLLEYDALFIRETTNVNHHTYRFAEKAEKEGIPCIDDTQSILRCCNKVYLHELLANKKINSPRTYSMLRGHHAHVLKHLDFPMVIKVPDGSFSRGVFRVNNEAEFNEKTEALFKHSELLLAQEFLPSDYDWRIVTLGGTPLFACKYFMAKKHWQIYNHGTNVKKQSSGDAEAVPLNKVPKNVLRTALKAANLIGKGLYGVDVKEINKTPYIIEINDNPNIDAGFEDEILGERLYEAIFDHFQDLIDA